MEGVHGNPPIRCIDADVDPNTRLSGMRVSARTETSPFRSIIRFPAHRRTKRPMMMMRI